MATYIKAPGGVPEHGKAKQCEAKESVKSNTLSSYGKKASLYPKAMEQLFLFASL